MWDNIGIPFSPRIPGLDTLFDDSYVRMNRLVLRQVPATVRTANTAVGAVAARTVYCCMHHEIMAA